MSKWSIFDMNKWSIFDAVLKFISAELWIKIGVHLDKNSSDTTVLLLMGLRMLFWFHCMPSLLPH